MKIHIDKPSMAALMSGMLKHTAAAIGVDSKGGPDTYRGVDLVVVALVIRITSGLIDKFVEDTVPPDIRAEAERQIDMALSRQLEELLGENRN